MPKAGSFAVISGWGKVQEGGSLSNNLRSVRLPIIDHAHCNKLYGGAITDRMICAGIVPDGGKDACQGDSGGPMVYNNELVGVTSWGIGCARPNFPGIYTNVYALMEFIKLALQQ